jgi:hypothetical protein
VSSQALGGPKVGFGAWLVRRNVVRGGLGLSWIFDDEQVGGNHISVTSVEVQIEIALHESSTFAASVVTGLAGGGRDNNDPNEKIMMFEVPTGLALKVNAWGSLWLVARGFVAPGWLLRGTDFYGVLSVNGGLAVELGP